MPEYSDKPELGARATLNGDHLAAVAIQSLRKRVTVPTG
jgi:hypothetical protein